MRAAAHRLPRLAATAAAGMLLLASSPARASVVWMQAYGQVDSGEVSAETMAVAADDKGFSCIAGTWNAAFVTPPVAPFQIPPLSVPPAGSAPRAFVALVDPQGQAIW